MRRAFTGISKLFLVSAREAVVDAAVAAGVERIVYLSFIGAAADATSPSLVTGDRYLLPTVAPLFGFPGEPRDRCGHVRRQSPR